MSGEIKQGDLLRSIDDQEVGGFANSLAVCTSSSPGPRGVADRNVSLSASSIPPVSPLVIFAPPPPPRESWAQKAVE